MRLGVNGLRLTGARLGVGRYLEYLLRWWPTLEHPFSEIAVYTPEIPADPIAVQEPVRLQLLGPRTSPAVWEHLVLPLRKPRDDLFFCPGYVVPLLSRGERIVVTHHGSYEAIPKAFPWLERNKARLLFHYSCLRAERVITVSESSKRDIMRFYGIPAARIEVIPQGVDEAFRPLDDPALLEARRRSYFPDGRPYLLFVGKLSTRRRIPELLEAFVRLVRRLDLPHGLVLIGPDSGGQPLRERVAELGIGERIVHRAFASHAELAEAYNAADLFIYPSDYEGFGVPVLEAMACGTPAIALNNSAFPEFAGGIAHFARDGSVEGLEEAMETVLFSGEIRARTRKEGPRRAEGYRWPAIARRTMQLLNEVACR
ncbi:MAG TPA: glycosyltransferase family 1 protein [Longimicrobiaceae bacterium]|nr:glycosyltransferase family 1 protein [Longimicrobiaceae bacterium]